MADTAQLFFSFPPNEPLADEVYDEEITAFLQKLDKISAKEYTKAGGGTDSCLLNHLNPAVQTLPYLKVLIAYIAPVEKFSKVPDGIPQYLRPDGAMWAQLVEFLGKYDPIQIRYVGKDWRRLLAFVYRVAAGFDMPVLAIHPFRSALLRLDPEGGVLTTHHLTFLRLCMASQAYGEALPILSNIIHSFPPKDASNIDAPYLCSNHAVSGAFINEKSGFTDLVSIEQVQEYFLLGGMAYIALQMWEDAQIFLEHVLVTPTQNVATGMMVEAYRKWLLVGCLATGQVPKPSKLINQGAIKDLKASSPHYTSLADIFVSENAPRLAAEVSEGAQLWIDDGNAGLVHMLPIHLQRFFVAKLEKTYSAIPVSMVANMLGLPADQAQPYLQELISQGHLNAIIESSSGDPILRFFMDPAAGPKAKSEADHLADMYKQAERLKVLSEYVRDADNKLELTKEYILKQLAAEQEKRTQASLEASGTFSVLGSGAMDVGHDRPELFEGMSGMPGGEDEADEDLMEAM
ncbi:hypothetical protein NA57DRAFT_34602 [Rhizodiscina lignyota]|uniref:COP9 signalosome complex subunit 3 n=1 Tax=Rhizodiscina lignyota TaxID=1504668 RepID=A0A9P4IIG4_9PEZI|nr:hypothetical protein NA57DRAFT_34602 [Rhizodiscina lignyota]